MSTRGSGVGRLRSIRFRIVAAFLAALVALMGAQGFLIWQQQRVGRSLALVTEVYLPLAKIVAQLERDRQRVETDVERLLKEQPRPPTGGSSPVVIYTDQIRIEIGEGRIHARDALRDVLPAEEKAVLNTILVKLDGLESLFAQYDDKAREALTLMEAGRKEDAKALAQPIKRAGKKLGEEIDTLARLVDGRIDHVTEVTNEARVRANTAAASLTAVAFLFSFLLVGAVLFALRPIGRLTEEVQRLAAGDYTGRVEVEGSDEVAVLAAEFNQMVRALEARDRTLVERAEQLNRLSRYLGSVLDSLEDGLLVVEDGRVTLANPAAARVWNAREQEDPPPALRELVDAPGRHEIRGPRDTLHEVRITPFGEHGLVVVTADVTEQTRAKEALARSERLALVGQMLAQITHEVRNPLNALSLNAELLADELGELDPERRTEAWDILAIVSAEIERLTDVTAHYLQLARRPPARLEPEDLGGLVEDVARLLDAELDQQGVTLVLDVHQLTPQLADGKQLRQALLNVVRNAVEAGARELAVRLTAAGDEIQLVLEDDGPGMTEEEAERACDPFFSTKVSGTGLGLAITKQILEDHGGTLRIRSGGAGTTIVLAMPARAAGVDEERAPHAADHPGRG